jgi:hypothetical protein
MLEACVQLASAKKVQAGSGSEGERGERRGVVGRAMLQDGVAGSVKQDVDDGTLGWRQHDRVHDSAPLVPAAVTTDQAEDGAGDGHVEDRASAELVS